MNLLITLLQLHMQSFTMVYLDGAITISLCFNEFINNEVSTVVYIPYYNATAKPTIANNLFIDNSAVIELFIDSDCRPDFSLSLGSSHCIQCSENRRRQDLIGIVVAAFIAGIALVIFMLALNMTVAVGTLNGILFYAHIITANTETYFLSFTAPSFVTVFISWLNLDVGFDVCFVKNEVVYLVSLDILYKALLQSAFPAYVIVLVIIVIVASEYSSKFANMVSKGNPVAVLATMILISYAKFLNVIFVSYLSVFYGQPAHGSRNIDVNRLPNVITIIHETNNIEYKAVNFFLLGTVIFVLLLCVIFTVLVFSWQWLLRYQDKAIFKWVNSVPETTSLPGALSCSLYC